MDSAHGTHTPNRCVGLLLSVRLGALRSPVSLLSLKIVIPPPPLRPPREGRHVQYTHMAERQCQSVRLGTLLCWYGESLLALL